MSEQIKIGEQPVEIAKPVSLDTATLVALQAAGMVDVATADDLAAVVADANALPVVRAELDAAKGELAAALDQAQKAQSDIAAVGTVRDLPADGLAVVLQQVRENKVNNAHLEINNFAAFRRNQINAALQVAKTGVDPDLTSLADAVSAFVGGG